MTEEKRVIEVVWDRQCSEETSVDDGKILWSHTPEEMDGAYTLLQYDIEAARKDFATIGIVLIGPEVRIATEPTEYQMVKSARKL